MTGELELRKNKLAKQNIWISLLRLFLSFVVIQDHYRPLENINLIQNVISKFYYLAVPCFMFISFYYIGDYFKNKKKIIKRIEKLLIPVIFWNVVYFCIKNIIYCLNGEFNRILNFKDLFYACLFSHYADLAAQLWFLIAQILIILLFSLLLFKSKNTRQSTIKLVGILLIAIVVEYFKINYVLISILPEYIGNTLGRTVECIPFAALGMIYCLNKNKTMNKKQYIILFLLSFSIIAKINTFTVPGFGYQGIYLISTSAVICIFLLSLPNTIKDKYKYVINYLGSCTMGIYSLHLLIGWVLIRCMNDASYYYGELHSYDFGFVIFIFVFSLIITILIKIINSRIDVEWLKHIV